MGLSTYSKNTILDYTVGAGVFGSPPTVYLSAHIGDPGLTGANEINSGVETWYARQAITFQAPNSRAIIQSTGNITFPSKSTSGTLTATDWGIWDTSTSGNFLGAGNPADQIIIQGKELLANSVKLTHNVAGITTSFTHEILNHIFRNITMTDPGDVFGVLLTTNPTDSGSIVDEVIISVGYSRQLLSFATASAGAIASNTIKTFGPATGAGFGIPTYFAVGKAGTRDIGDLIYYSALSPNNQAIIDMFSLILKSGDIIITL